MLTPELENRLAEAKQLGVYTPAFIELPTEFSDNRVRFVVGYFHAKEIYSHTEADNLWMGIRANHFAVEIGTIEHNLGYLGLDDLGVKESLHHVEDGIYEGESAQFCLVTGNHKGTRVTTIWLLKDTLKFY